MIATTFGKKKANFFAKQIALLTIEFYCLVFAFVRNYGWLFIARATQGVGFSCTVVPGKISFVQGQINKLH